MSKKVKGAECYERKRATPSFSTTWVRHPIRALIGVGLRVLIYACYSTDEQNPHSIDAQVSYCRRFLEQLGVTDYEHTVISDEGISGEKIWRPGLNQVRDGIERKLWNLILVEDSSRLVRDPGPCGQLVRSALDQGIRTICLNDYVDTSESERWEETLWEAQRHHAQANKYTIFRIKRNQAERWETGAAMGHLHPGYKRIPSYPATEREPAKGPFFDEVDPAWVPVIYEAFESFAAGQPVWMVGDFLRDKKLPGINGDATCSWTDREVLAFIKCEHYRGMEDYRETISVKKNSTGDREQKRAQPSEMWLREMEHLRIIPDWLWFKANDTIAVRTRKKAHRRGEDHPLAGIPRDSRGPLSEVFICGCEDCNQKMGSSD